ncbi:MAG: TldD/PmbA family protein [Clostridia bacterium]|nr:TldD/PmbA family protein [Clostridia bacterium]
MKMEALLEQIRAVQGADAWSVTERTEEGWEFYLIRGRLDQHRARQTRTFSVTLYAAQEDGKYLGSANAPIAPTATPEEAARILADLRLRAAYVRNPFYTLVRPDGRPAEPAPAPDTAAIARDFLVTLRDLPQTADADLNSAEVFVTSVRERLVNSEGVDVTGVWPSGMVEAVVNARRDGHEVELYRMLRSGSCDAEGLRRQLGDALRFSRDRLGAVPTPALGKTTVLFSTDAACQIYGWFIDRMSTGMRYRRISDWEPGKPVVDGAQGDLVTVETLPALPNASRTCAFDAEGARIEPFTVIDKGIAARSWGGRQFSCYLGLEDSCVPNCFAVTGGSMDAEELRAGDHLEIVEFSDFQVDPFNGDIAGEIRLGYLRRGGETTVVTGGSVSGSMAEFAKSMRMSRETVQYDTLSVPAVTALYGVTVAGVEE